jgi:signal transduction histidine kinase
MIADADIDQCVRIICNLCSNAIRWSPPRSKIRLRARKDADFIIIEVQDSGQGVPSEFRETLFQRWQAGKSAPKQMSSSTGLGLYIARKFSELQGGSIGVKSAEPAGAIFWFSLPRA